MITTALLITVLTVCIVCLQLFKHWIFAKGNLWLSYRLNCLIFTGYLIVETIVAFNAPGQLSLLLMNIVNIWALIMNTKGILRLKEEDKLAQEKQRQHRELTPVVLESPYRASSKATLKEHEIYTRRCMKDSLSRDEAPFASHLLYNQMGILNDFVEEERSLMTDAGFSWRKPATKTVVYTDYGTSRGMKVSIEHALLAGHAIEYRTIGKNPIE